MIIVGNITHRLSSTVLFIFSGMKGKLLLFPLEPQTNQNEPKLTISKNYVLHRDHIVDAHVLSCISEMIFVTSRQLCLGGWCKFDCLLCSKPCLIDNLDS